MTCHFQAKNTGKLMMQLLPESKGLKTKRIKIDGIKSESKCTRSTTNLPAQWLGKGSKISLPSPLCSIIQALKNG